MSDTKRIYLKLNNGTTLWDTTSNNNMCEYFLYTYKITDDSIFEKTIHMQPYFGIVYYADIPADYYDMLFTRQKPGTTDITYDKSNGFYNQTSDIYIGDNNFVTITGWTGSDGKSTTSLSKYERPQDDGSMWCLCTELPENLDDYRFIVVDSLSDGNHVMCYANEKDKASYFTSNTIDILKDDAGIPYCADNTNEDAITIKISKNEKIDDTDTGTYTFSHIYVDSETNEKSIHIIGYNKTKNSNTIICCMHDNPEVDHKYNFGFDWQVSYYSKDNDLVKPLCVLRCKDTENTTSIKYNKAVHRFTQYKDASTMIPVYLFYKSNDFVKTTPKISFDKTDDVITLSSARYKNAIIGDDAKSIKHGIYSVDNDSIAAVTGDGTVNLLAPGKVTVTFTTNDTDIFYGTSISYTLNIYEGRKLDIKLKEQINIIDNKFTKYVF
jgi:hypothetical protein